MATKTIQEWYDSLPRKIQAERRNYIISVLGVKRSSFYDILTGKFIPSQKQSITNLAECPIKWGGSILYPEKQKSAPDAKKSAEKDKDSAIPLHDLY